jgi:glycosyltransferase involved in cell wall biosynthesis
MRILFCPAHYLYDDFLEGSELSWAYNIADRISSVFAASVVITGRSTVGPRPYRIIELTPGQTRLNFGPAHAVAFNARYTLATFRALHQSRFDVVHHVLPFALGRTYNLATLRHGVATPFVIGPIQPRLSIRDTDVDPADLSAHLSRGVSTISLPRRLTVSTAGLVSDVVAPAVSGISARTVRRAAAVVAVNTDARDLLIRSGAPPSRVIVIPPGIDANRFRPSTPIRGRSRGLELLSVSRLLRRKNLDVVIRAFAKVLEVAPQTTLRIVGDGPQRQALTALARGLGVGDKVTFTGFVPNAKVHREYHQADVFVNASAAEGFATTCLEALASGLPVVSTRVGGFGDAVRNDWNGYVLHAADVDELAATLSRLVEHPTLVARLSGQARQMAERDFDWDTAVIPRYLQLYTRVTRGHEGVSQ